MLRQNRRDFLRSSAAYVSAASLAATLPRSIQAAAAIAPDRGSTWRDAEHVVILMQENRSFDHMYGSLRGVRGFNDPRALMLPNGNPVWTQTNAAGQTYAPFRLNIRETNATWMGSLPHSWGDQVDARNGGRYDRWLDAKRSGHDAYAEMPLTLGYYTRDDIPFYYELADAFTICDQHFCSCLTGTTANRLHLWTGTIRDLPRPDSPARVLNSQTSYDDEATWTTFLERLEQHGVSWKIYQNEITLDSGLTGEEMAWLSNFDDNPIEYFKQFNVRFASGHRRWLATAADALANDVRELLAALEAGTGDVEVQREHLARKLAELEKLREKANRWSEANYSKLSPYERNLHERAFATNSGDKFYRTMEEWKYEDGDVQRQARGPRGDVLHQFRRDVQNGQLPTVSWVVAPERFSDHPSSAWFGAWYVAELFDILTKNPDVWKRTIFILTYDENDGYFDHVPPFVAPNPQRPETGSVSAGIDAATEYVDPSIEQTSRSSDDTRASSIGLGYRVPMVIASPWSRGGNVCSQVFDHTSPLQMLEKLLTHKTGREIKESNISDWRRAVCGDLTSSFRGANDQETAHPAASDRDRFLEQIFRAEHCREPAGFAEVTPEQLAELRNETVRSPLLPVQEPGVRPSAPLPYELSVEATLCDDGHAVEVEFAVGNERFGECAAGAPFIAYAKTREGLFVRDYAVAAGERVVDRWKLTDFVAGRYALTIYGPNGFYRGFCGDAAEPQLAVRLGRNVVVDDDGAPQKLLVEVANRDRESWRMTVSDLSYGAPTQSLHLPAGHRSTCDVDLAATGGWYDIRISCEGRPHDWRRYAGRAETGVWGTSDPAMGRPLTPKSGEQHRPTGQS